MAKSMVEKYEQILAADPGSLVFIELARALCERGEAARAVEVCDRGLAHHPRSVQGRVTRGRALLLLGRTGDAVEEFDRAMGLDPENPYAFNLVGEALLERRQFVLALPVLRRAAALQPGDLRVRGWLEVAQREVNAAGGAPSPVEAASLGTYLGGEVSAEAEVARESVAAPKRRSFRGVDPAADFEVLDDFMTARANVALEAPATLVAPTPAPPDATRQLDAPRVLAAPTPVPPDALARKDDSSGSGQPASAESQASAGFPTDEAEVVGTVAAPPVDVSSTVLMTRADADPAPPDDRPGAVPMDDFVPASLHRPGESGGDRPGAVPIDDSAPAVSSGVPAEVVAGGHPVAAAPPPLPKPPPLPRRSGGDTPTEVQQAAAMAADYEAELRRRLGADRADPAPGFTRGHKVGIALVALGVVATVAGALAWSWVRAERRDDELAADVTRARVGLARDTHAALRASVETLKGILDFAPDHAQARALDARARAALAVVYGDGDVEVARRLVEEADAAVEPGAVLSARRLLARDDAERRTVDDAILAAPASGDPELDSLAGVILVARGQQAQAIERFNAAISAGAGHVPTFVRIGDYYRGRGEHEDALSYYTLALAVAEDHPGAVLGAAESRLASTIDPAPLREALARIDRIGPDGVPVADRVRIALLRSRLHAALDDRAGALAALAGVEERIGGDRSARVALAEALADAGAYDRAEVALQALLATPVGGVPSPASIREVLARVLVARERYAAVVELPAGPEERQLHLWKGIAWLRLGELAKARAEFRATASPPENKLPVDAVAYLALADLAGGDVARARANLERVGKGSRARPTGRWAWGTALMAQGNLDEARVAFEEALATDPRHLEARCALGRLLLARGEIGPAIEQLSRVVEANPFHREAVVALGLARLEAGEPALALERLRAARALTPEDPKMAAALALALVRQGKPAEAEAELADAGASRDPLMLRARGELALAKGDAAGAIKALTAAAATPDVAVLATLGDLHLSRADGRAALAAFSRATKVGPGSHRARLGVARAQVALGRTGAAEKALLDLLASLPESAATALRAASHAALAEALLVRPHDRDRARSAAEEAVRLDRRSAPAHVALGKVLSEAGESAEAEPHFARAVELAPNDASIRLARGLFLAGRASGATEARRELAKAMELAPGSPVAVAAKGALRR